MAGDLERTTEKAVGVRLLDGSLLWLPLSAVEAFSYDDGDTAVVRIGERVESVLLRPWFADRSELPLLDDLPAVDAADGWGEW